MRYHFGHHTLDLDAHELRHGSQAIDLEPQAVAVLAHLVRNRHRVVTKAELLDDVWGDRFVSDSALTTRIKHCRRAVGDDGHSQHVIRTIHRVGYRFVADVHEALDDPVVAPTWPDRRPIPVPAPARPLFGRGRALRGLLDRVETSRLVTVTGTGGIGKSALCGALGSAPPPGLTDGVAWCELATTRDPASVPTVALAAVGEGQHIDADPLESLLRAMARRRQLLVLDNCEHVAPAAATLADNLLRRCPEVRIVATSRAPLGVAGERVMPLDPLDLDASAACFRSRALDAGATVDPDDPAVHRLCERLDGIPLALELAAARTRVLAPRQLLDLLDDRFRVLHQPTGDDARHRSLEQVIASSWDDLEARDQRLLAHLSTLVGRFSLDDAAAVADPGGDRLEVIDGLERLVLRSMVVSDVDADGSPAFGLLESIRDFAAARLEGADEARRRHCHHFAARAEALDAAMQTRDIDAAIGGMGAAWANVRAAVGYAAADHDTTTVRRIVAAVGPYADLHQTYEVLDWCARAALDVEATTPDDAPLLADASAIHARLLAHRGQHDRARRLAEAAHARHESRTTVLSVIWCAYYGGDLDRVLERATRLAELSRSQRGMDHGFAQGFTAVVATVRQEAVDTVPAASPEDAATGALGALDCLVAGFRLCAADPTRAAALLEAVVQAALEHEYRLLLGAAASTLTQITLPGHPPDDAMRTLCRTLTAYRDRGMWALISADTVMAAKLLADAGDQATACRLLGARAASGYRVGLSEVLRTSLQADLERELGDDCTRLAADGARWNPPEAADAALRGMQQALARFSS